MRAVRTSRLIKRPDFRWVIARRSIRLVALALAACSSTAAPAVPSVHVGTLSPAQPNQEERFGFAVDVLGGLAVVGAYGDSPEGRLFRGSASVYRLGNVGVREPKVRNMSSALSPPRSTSSASRSRSWARVLRAANGTRGTSSGRDSRLPNPSTPPVRSAPRAGSRSAAASSMHPMAS